VSNDRELAHAYRRCEEITREQAANFHYGIRLLPRDKRVAMSAVYAFARRVDDIGDGDRRRHVERALDYMQLKPSTPLEQVSIDVRGDEI